MYFYSTTSDHAAECTHPW